MAGMSAQGQAIRKPRVAQDRTGPPPHPKGTADPMWEAATWEERKRFLIL